eukprot:COSAG01_NODE_3842_length_5645_cov_314.103498_1_plen_119_part_00
MATLRDGCGPPHRRYSQALIGPASSNFFSPLIPMPMQLVLTTTARALRCAAGHQPAAGGGGGGGGGALDRRTSDGDGKMLWAAEARDSQSIEYRETSMATKSRLIQVGVGVKGLTPQR